MTSPRRWPALTASRASVVIADFRNKIGTIDGVIGRVLVDS